MGILDILIVILALTLAYRHIFLSVTGCDISPHIRVCFLGNSGGIGTQIGYKPHGPISLDINSFIELLCDPHRLRGSEIQRLGRLLLQCTGCKRHRGLLRPLALLDLLHRIFCRLHFFQDLIQLLFGMDRHLLICAVEFGGQKLPLAIYLKLRIQRPVFLRYERIDLFFPVRNDPKRHRLYPARA